MKTYSIDTTDEQENLFVTWCAQNSTTPELEVNYRLQTAIDDFAKTCSSGIAATVSDKYSKATEPQKAQIDAILALVAPAVIILPE